ncbi:olfactory receptor 11A1-like [Patiria miniata]|uniref:G-protein coupled receptors family 1 profile domain-containing protein n=1 Tax=Patiria miniata TaxID=46514 RepID=A0A914BN54_PATMI|nr:olfactory receptor 11A1-like [Patiria miniata]
MSSEVMNASNANLSQYALGNISTTPILSYYGAGELTVAGVIVVVLFPVGLLSNCSFLFVVLCIRSMRTPFNTFLSNLAVAEISLLTLVLVRTLTAGNNETEETFSGSNETEETFPENTDEDGTFPIIVFAMMGACFASNLFVTVAAAERYLAVCAPMKYVLIARDQRRAVKISLGVWLADGIYVALFALTVHLFDRQIKIALFVLYVVIFLTILVADSFFYLSILKRLRKRPSSVHQRRIVIKLAATALVIYANATVHATLMITMHLIHTEIGSSIVRNVFLLSKVMTSTISPLVHGFLSLDLHELSAKIVFRSCCQREP